MRVHIPGPLRSYTEGRSELRMSAPSLEGLLQALDRRYPGFRFRIVDEQDAIRPHIKVFVNSEQVRALHACLSTADEVHIICALSGG